MFRMFEFVYIKFYNTYIELHRTITISYSSYMSFITFCDI
jgi:hypothetical protein